MVAMQRTVFCAHYASDVLAGAGLAWLFVLGLFRLRAVDRVFRRFERPKLGEATTYNLSRAA